MKLVDNLSDFGEDLLAFLFPLALIGSKTEADRSDGFFLGFKFAKSVFVFFLDFGVANNVEKDLNDKVMVRVLDFGL
jgi:hypothetical protein